MSRKNRPPPAFLTIPDPEVGDRYVFLSSLVFTAAVMAIDPAGALGPSPLAPQKRSLPVSAAIPAPVKPQALPATQYLVSSITSKWNIDPVLARTIVEQSIVSGMRHEVDPLLILAVISVESSFRPNAVSSERAEGLMQVRRRAHMDVLQAVGVPRTARMSVRQNIEIGTRVLSEYLARERGRLVPALQRYNGARNEPELRYAARVLAAYRPLVEATQALQSAADASVAEDTTQPSSTRRPRV
jgi:soluble lytic murein transglycosylase-like protein